MVSGGAGDDKVFLGDGADQTAALNEDGSFDTAGMEGDDLIRGGNGRDILIDALGSNTIYGDLGYDRISTVDDDTSQDTPDTVFGGFGEDVMFVDHGDVVSGGAHDDRFQVITDVEGDAVTITDFEDGDTPYLRDANGGYVIQERITTELTADGEDTNVLLDGVVAVILEGTTVRADGAIDNPTAPPIFGTLEADTLEIGEFGDRVIGFDGDDVISFAAGEDTTGRDMDVMGGSGDDTITLGLGDDSVQGGLGADTIFSGGDSDEFYGGYCNDILNSAGDPADTVFGGAGDDTFYADGGDALIGGTGANEYNINFSDPAATAVAIDDFDPATEQLNIDVSLALDAVPTITYEIAASGSGTNLLVDGNVVAFLVGVDPSTLNAVNVTNTNVTI
jgi:Ca2+-binding RTX toxin-like protein